MLPYRFQSCSHQTLFMVRGLFKTIIMFLIVTEETSMRTCKYVQPRSIDLMQLHHSPVVRACYSGNL